MTELRKIIRGLFVEVYRWIKLFGFDPRKTVNTLFALPRFFKDFFLFQREGQRSTAEFPIGKIHPCLADKQDESGTARGHYFHQDFLIARRIFDHAPRRHVDIGSRLDGFVAHVATFRPLEVVDVRPLRVEIHNVTVLQADLMQPLPDELAGCCDSLSCLHALEHFGLGRYGDPLAYDGHLRGLTNMSKLLVPKGRFYLSVPIGKQRVEFNAHRVFSIKYMLDLLSDEFELNNFSYVDDFGDLHEDAELSVGNINGSFGCTYGCGIFELTKKD